MASPNIDKALDVMQQMFNDVVSIEPYPPVILLLVLC